MPNLFIQLIDYISHYQTRQNTETLLYQNVTTFDLLLKT